MPVKKNKKEAKDQRAITHYPITITLTEPCLGTVPKNQAVYGNFVSAKALELFPDKVDEIHKELESVQSVEEKGWTGFHLEDGKPFFYDYWVKGLFKSACDILRRDGGSASFGLTAYKKLIDGQAFIKPRKIFWELSGPVGVLERPIRCQTAQGERISVVRSDTVPAGSKASFIITVLGDDITGEIIEEWMNYGQYRGFGQWRNASYGQFTWAYTEAAK